MVARSMVLVLAVQAVTAAAQYQLRTTYDASNFAESFNFLDSAVSGDPTAGFVHYANQSTAVSEGLFRILTGSSDQGEDQVFIGVDNYTILSSDTLGRDSLRLEALDTFDSGLLVADIAHMPGNQCGIWPAFWSYNFDGDPIAEIDMIEGAGFQADNMMSLHTCETCQFTAASEANTRTDFRSDCGLGANCSTDTTGCGITTAANTSTYGDAANAAGGSVYALQLEVGILKYWNFPRSRIPADITVGTPDPSSWGNPVVAFEKANGGCDIGGTFYGQTLIINTEMCGEAFTDEVWQGDPVCSQYSSCPSLISENPDMLSEAYWLFNSIKLYN